MSFSSDGSILIAEDDDEDFFLTKKAIEKGKISLPLIRVTNGQELLDYLQYDESSDYTKKNEVPKLILLDLNMPIMDGRTALKFIKKDPRFSKIPVIVLTTSKAEEDVVKSYSLGVNSFIRKPVQFSDFIEVMNAIHKYWFRIVELP